MSKSTKTSKSRLYKKLALGGASQYLSKADQLDAATPLTYKNYNPSFENFSAYTRNKQAATMEQDQIQSKIENAGLSSGNPWIMAGAASAKLSRLGSHAVDKATTDQFGVTRTGGGVAARSAAESANGIGNMISAVNNLKSHDLTGFQKAMGFTPVGAIIDNDILAKKEREKYLNNFGKMQSQLGDERYRQALAAGFNPHGNEDENNYKMGGKLYKKMKDGGIYIKPSHRGRFTEYKERTGKTTEEALHSSDPHVRKMAQFAENAKHWNHGAYGGSLEDLSRDNKEVVGRSHSNGGVKFPESGVELEGGETINKDFVFSKELGFAQKHKSIAKQIGKIEDKPQNRYTRNSLERLKEREELLKVQQEATKKELGMPNELDKNPSELATKAMGGSLYKKLWNGGFSNPKLSNYDKDINNLDLVGKNRTSDYYTPDLGNESQIGGGLSLAKTSNNGTFSSTGGNSSNSLGNILNTDVLPYSDNILNYTLNRQRAKQQVPNMARTSFISPVKFDYSASKVEADNQRRAFNKSIDANNLDVGVANSNKAAGLYQTIMAKNNINQDEYNANVEAKQRANEINKQIESGNNSIDFENNMRRLTAKDDIRREDSMNMANLVEKRGVYGRDKKLDELYSDQNKLGLAATDIRTSYPYLKSNPEIAKKYGIDLNKMKREYEKTIARDKGYSYKNGGTIYSKLTSI